MSPIISVSNLSKTYGSGFKALNGVNLDINKGEIFALLGPNGAGKTTLISIVCGIANLSEGRVTVNGHDINRDYRAARSLIGLCRRNCIPTPSNRYGRPSASAAACSASRRILIISRRC